MKLHGKLMGPGSSRLHPTLGPRLAGVFRSPQESGGLQFQAPALVCPYSWLHFSPKCEYVFMHSSHGPSNSQTPNTDALYNFPVFFAAGNLSGVWLDCLIFFSLCDLLNCFGGSRLSRDWRQARSFTPDRARPPHPRGRGMNTQDSTVSHRDLGDSVEEGADDKGLAPQETDAGRAS